MKRFLFTSKIIIAGVFLLTAYLFFTDKNLFGLKAEVLLMIISILGGIILFIGEKNKPRR